MTTCTLISVLKLIMMWQLGETSVFCCSFQYNAVLSRTRYKARRPITALYWGSSVCFCNDSCWLSNTPSELNSDEAGNSLYRLQWCCWCLCIWCGVPRRITWDLSALNWRSKVSVFCTELICLIVYGQVAVTVNQWSSVVAVPGFFLAFSRFRSK